MTDLSLFTISASATLFDAVEKIQQNRCRCVFVIQQDKVAGVISEGDVMRALLKGTDVYTILSELVKPSFVYMHSRDLQQAFMLFRKHQFTLIPVVDDDFHLLDVIALREVMEHLQFKAPSEANS